MSAVRKVLIQGAGIGGLALATALARRGIEVDLVEGAGRAAVLGVGLNQPMNALGVLETLGLKDECIEVGFPFEDLVFWNTAGEKVMAVPPAQGRYDKPSNNAIGRPAYFDILAKAAQDAGARIEIGRTVLSIDDKPDGVEVEIGIWRGRHEKPEVVPGGDKRVYDLLVGFDGSRSSIRSHLFGEAYKPEFTGSGVWRATIPRPEYVTEVTLVMAPDNVKAVLTPISDDQMYFGLVTPEPGNPRHSQEDFVRLFRDRTSAFTGRLAELRDLVSDDSTRVYLPLEHVVVREPWFRGRVVIAGDAAHTSPPHLSQGAAMALEDAVTLAESLESDDDLDTALGAWYERRVDRVSFIADLSLALLRAETGTPLTGHDEELLKIGVQGAHARIAQEAY